ncbi:ParA family protein [Alloalcanivorax xenomutans]|uniref:ParA family protein n=1 Tax=Alloalcanivorax xenomutans TaxID=1094342 RepID=UPI0007A74645|nr:ParA family protein [Alloalcanivorax xenomutans]ARB46955.1 chromosome partitioning protein [Alloalcanivorax xenomutans]KYZ87809.1 chromosome partitioning protein [Alcanivorax sp. KX64203]
MIVTICSTKGGVGKTTTTANLGGILADAGQRVLLVDADIQPTLSSYYPLSDRAPYGLHQLVTSGSVEGCISQTTIPNLDIVISDDPEGSLENWILHTPDGRIRMRTALRATEGYDVVLIDTQGAVGPLQDVGVLAGDLLLSPIPPEILSAREFARGTLGMLDRLQPMQHLGAPVGHLYGLLYRMDHTVDARQVADTLRKATFAESRGAISVLDTVVPSTVVYREAATAQVPVHRLERRRRGTAPSALETLSSLVGELFPHIDLGGLRDEI